MSEIHMKRAGGGEVWVRPDQVANMEHRGWKQVKPKAKKVKTQSKTTTNHPENEVKNDE